MFDCSSSSWEDFYYSIINFRTCQEFFYFFKNYFNSLFRWSCLYKTVIILAFLLSFVKVFLNISSLEILYCSSSLSEDFIILSSLSYYVNKIFNLFSFYFSKPSNTLIIPLYNKKERIVSYPLLLLFLLYIVKIKHSNWQVSLMFWS